MPVIVEGVRQWFFGNMMKALDHFVRKVPIMHIRVHTNFPYNIRKFSGDIVNSPLRLLREQMSPPVSFFFLLFLILKVISEYTLKEKNSNNIKIYSVNLDSSLHLLLAPPFSTEVSILTSLGCILPVPFLSINVFLKTCLVFSPGRKSVLFWV